MRFQRHPKRLVIAQFKAGAPRTTLTRRTVWPEEPSRNALSRERCNVRSNVISVPTTHRKIHLCMRADERGHEIILVKSVFSTNYLKGRRVCNDAPQTSANDVACRASILSYMPAALNIPSICHSRRKGQRKASSKAKSIVSHKFLRLIRAAFHIVLEADRTQVCPPLPLPDHAAYALFISSKGAPGFQRQAKAMCLRHSKCRQYSRTP
jgi:hypothetical protein